MKWLTSLLIGCSLGLAGAIMAQQPAEQETPKKNKETVTEKTPRAPGAERKSRLHEESPTSEQGAKQHGMKGERAGKGETTNAASSPSETNANQEGAGGKKGRKHANESTATTATTSPGTNEAEQGRKGRKERGENAVNARTTPEPSAAAMATAAPATNAPASRAGAVGATNANGTAVQGNVGRGGKRVEAQQLTQIKEQHRSFHAQPRPDKAPAVSFNADFRIQGSDRWQGPRYEAFRSYRPERHDRGWYSSHYRRVELIGGGYYYWNNGYWYPAWGYDPSSEYYAYNGPIYVGQRAEPPDQVIADVQAELKDMGYYEGEVDGLLGPMTQQALADYQSEHGLDQTSAIDEPTLESLQLS